MSTHTMLALKCCAGAFFLGFSACAQAASAPAINSGHGGSWYNPESSGQGVFLEVLPRRKQLVLGWFTYAEGAPGNAGDIGHRWFTGIGPIEENRADLELFFSRGGVFAQPGIAITEPIGQASIQFQSCSEATLNYQFDNGLAGTIEMIRGARSELCLTLSGQSVSLDFDFGVGDSQGWTGGFADYPEGEEDFYELSFTAAALPIELGAGAGLEISGNNHSDDLFMYVTRPVTDLAPNINYTVDIEAIIGTNAPSDCAGVGGAPGSGVYFKAGVVSLFPNTATTPESMGHLRINLDKGNQSQGGSDMAVIGHIGNTRTCPDTTYENKTMKLTGFTATTGIDGTLHIILGTDSGFESTTTLYYDRVTVTLTPVP